MLGRSHDRQLSARSHRKAASLGVFEFQAQDIGADGVGSRPQCFQRACFVIGRIILIALPGS